MRFTGDWWNSVDMKSLQIIGSKQMGGAERWFVRYLQALKARHHEVMAVVRRGSELDSDILAGLPATALPMRTVWDPLSRREVSRLIERERPEIVQTYMGRATRLTRLAPRGGIVHIARLGGYYKPDGYRHAHAWIGNTRGICDYLIQSGFPAKRVFHIYNFAEPAREVSASEILAVRERAAIQPDDLLLMTAGRFVTFKGQRFLLEAFAQLPERLAGKRLRLAVLGDGPLRSELHQLAASLGIDGRVIWAGWQFDPAPWYAAADIVVFPSRDDEPMGNVVLEAWSFAKPLVTTLFRGAREFVTHGEDAWCVPCDDAPALAGGIRAVVTDEALQQGLVAGARATLRRDFSEDAVVAQYEQLYQELAAAGPI